MMTTELHVRWMIRKDMPRVLEIERTSFSDQWTENDFIAHLRARLGIGMVAEVGQEVVGFVMYELRPRSYELVNFAVHPQYRRMGVGTGILERIKAKLSFTNRRSIEFYTSERNLAAHLFFRSLGCVAIKVVEDHYGVGHAAYRMRFHITGNVIESLRAAGGRDLDNADLSDFE